MSKAVALVAFNGEAMCFVHVLLNALDMYEKGYQVKVVVEGAAVKVVNELNDEQHPFARMYQEVRDKGLIDCVCQACAAKLGRWTESRRKSCHLTMKCSAIQVWRNILSRGTKSSPFKSRQRQFLADFLAAT